MSRKRGITLLAIEYLVEYGPASSRMIAEALRLKAEHVSTALSHAAMVGKVRVLRGDDGSRLYESTGPVHSIGHRAGMAPAIKSRKRQSSSGVTAPAPYRRGYVWGRSWI